MTEFHCQETVEGRPLRIAGGFPCPYPGKYVVEYVAGAARKRVCGIHRRQLLRLDGWAEVT